MRCGCKCRSNHAQGTGEQEIIRIDKTEDIPARLCKAFVQTIRRAIIRFEDNLVYSVTVAFDDLSTTVRRTRIDHDILDVRVVLLDDRADCLFEKTCLIEG